MLKSAVSPDSQYFVAGMLQQNAGKLSQLQVTEAFRLLMQAAAMSQKSPGGRSDGESLRVPAADAKVDNDDHLLASDVYRHDPAKEIQPKISGNEESPPLSPKPDGTLIGQPCMESASLAQTETTQPPKTSAGHLMPSPPRGEAGRSRPTLSSFLLYEAALAPSK